MKLARVAQLVLPLALSFYGTAVLAQYPDKAVKIILPYAVGGGNDIITRIVAQKMSENTGKSFIVDNRTGAGGRIGYEFGIKSAGDGYTLIANETSYTMMPALYGSKLPWDNANALVPITNLAEWFFVVVAAPKLNVTTLKGLIDLAKANPGKLNYGTAGAGTINHIASELFKREAHVDIAHIPYKGMGPAITGMLEGSIDVLIVGTAPVVTHINAGRMIPLAMASPRRSAILPHVPSAVEAGVPNFVVRNYAGLSAPKGTPREIVDWLQKEAAKALASPAVKERFAAQGVEPSGITPEAFSKLIQEDVERWTGVISAARITAE
jgi:tripartite-type tricarboxylate transporter receptor subunit TctC